MSNRNHRIRSFVAIALAGALSATAFIAGSNPAHSQESFYKGKTLNVVIRSGPGGGNDFYGRLVARHIGKHIPGKPDTISTNMGGSGGIVAANYMAVQAKRDGSEIAILGRDIAVAQRIGATGVRYDVRKLIPLGSASSSTWAWVIKGDHPVKGLKDLKTYKGTVKFSGTGAGTGSIQLVKLLKDDGFPVQPISGYDGTGEKLLAVARGEVQATSGSYGSLLKGIQEENLRVIGRLGKHKDLMNVMDAREILSDGMRALANMMAAPFEAGRPYYTAPEVPRDRVQILRAAFKGALHDPKLLNEAKRSKKDINWVGAEDVEKIVKEILNAPDKIVDQFKAM